MASGALRRRDSARYTRAALFFSWSLLLGQTCLGLYSFGTSLPNTLEEIQHKSFATYYVTCLCFLPAPVGKAAVQGKANGTVAAARGPAASAGPGSAKLQKQMQAFQAEHSGKVSKPGIICLHLVSGPGGLWICLLSLHTAADG